MKKVIAISIIVCLTINYGIYRYYESFVLDLCNRAKLKGMVLYQEAIITESKNAYKENRDVEVANFNEISGFNELRKKYYE